MSQSGLNEHPAVTNFRTYLQIRSVHPNPDYEGCVTLLKKLYAGVADKCDVYQVAPGKPIVLFTKVGTQASLPSILLNSHMDVVPVFEEKWKYGPFDGCKDSDGNIYGRGAQDMKCVGIMFMEALRNLSGTKLPRTVHVSFVPDEEIGGAEGMKAWVRTEHFKQLQVGFAIDESAPYSIPAFLLFYNERTSWTIKFVCRGQSGHGSVFHSNTAGEKLSRVLAEMFKFREDEEAKMKENPETWSNICTTVNLTIVEGGVQKNVLPEVMTATFDCRIAPTVDFDEFSGWLQEVCQRAGKGVTVEFPHKESKSPTTPLDDSNQFWVALKATSDKLGTQLAPITCPGTTDARYLRQVGIPAVGLTPINDTPCLIHDHNEFVHEDKLLRGIEIYQEIIKGIASVEN